MAKNPVMFVTEAVAALVTIFWLRDIFSATGTAWFSGQIALWLWFTVLFANFAEAVAEGRGKAQADALRRTRTDTKAKRLLMPAERDDLHEIVSALDLDVGDIVVVTAGEIIPADGEVIEGIASVNESAITGESAPVIRESGGDRSAVTGGTTVLSDRIKVRVTAAAGSTFLDRMIALVEGAERQKTPNELALSILLSGMTLIFLIAVVTLWGLAGYSGTLLSVTVLVALARHPHSDDHRRASVGHRHCRHGSSRSASMSWRHRAARWKRQATSTHCCSTRPARLPSAIAWQRPSFRFRA